MAVNKDKKTGKWYYRIYVNDITTGSRIQKYKTGFDLKRDALEAEAELVSSYHNREVVIDDINFDDLVSEYIAFLEKSVKTTTVVGYKYQIEKHIIPFFTKKKIKNITRFNMDSWYKYVDELEFGYQYKNKLLTRLKGIFQYAEDQYNFRFRFINLFPIFKKKHDEVKRKNVIYTEEMFKQFISYADNTLEKTIFYTLFYTGLRIGEFRALTWNDINFKDNSITINKQVTSKIPGEGPTLTTPKSSSSMRVVQIPNLLVDVLKEWYNERSLKGSFNKSWNVFGDTSFISENRIRRMVARISEASNLPYLTLHDFRHSYSTLLRTYKIDPKIVQAQAGHSSVKITLDTYTHINIEEQQRTIIDLFNEENKEE